MANAIFLFHGGNYKRETDNGRVRVPLTPLEAQNIVTDRELTHKTPTSVGAELPMAKYADQFCDLAVDDEIFIGLTTDAAVYRGLWMASHDAVKDLKMKLELVSIKDVYAAYEDGDATGVDPFVPAAIEYDFTKGLGESTKDAVLRAQLYGQDWSDHRNEEALVVELFDAKAALLGEALYFRLTVTDLGALGTEEGACCNSCGGVAYPTFQVGAVFDELCFDKQRMKTYCNCPEQLCGDGCG